MTYLVWLYIVSVIFTGLVCFFAIRDQGYADVSDILYSLGFTLIPLFNTIVGIYMFFGLLNEKGFFSGRIWTGK
jgi:hypothetical protein